VLPFLKKSKEAAGASDSAPVIRQTDEDKEIEHDGLETALEELAQHMLAKDWKACAECFRAAQELVEFENEHTDKEE
jgi:hypothetical protein